MGSQGGKISEQIRGTRNAQCERPLSGGKGEVLMGAEESAAESVSFNKRTERAKFN